jgi:hypothetical protein
MRFCHSKRGVGEHELVIAGVRSRRPATSVENVCGHGHLVLDQDGKLLNQGICGLAVAIRLILLEVAGSAPE